MLVLPGVLWSMELQLKKEGSLSGRVSVHRRYYVSFNL